MKVQGSPHGLKDNIMLVAFRMEGYTVIRLEDRQAVTVPSFRTLRFAAFQDAANAGPSKKAYSGLR